MNNAHCNELLKTMIMKQNHLKWFMCMDVSHNTNRANPQVISFDNDKDI